MYEWGFTSSMLVSVPEYSFGVSIWYSPKP
jgi:hypothetical protein